jgi:hypothetical protein
MSEEQRNEETEVEAHKHGVHANEEPRDEAEDNDEVEGHGITPKLSGPSSLGANDEAGRGRGSGIVPEVQRPVNRLNSGTNVERPGTRRAPFFQCLETRKISASSYV